MYSSHKVLMPRHSSETSWVRYQQGTAYLPITAGKNMLDAMSSGPGWEGLHLEIGETIGWEGEDMMVDGHFVALNIADRILHFETRAEDDARWVPATRLPGAFWIQAEGSPLSHRVTGKTRWAAAIIEGKALDAAMGRTYELRSGINVVDGLLERLFRALIDVLLSPTPQSLPLVKSLVHSFVLALATRHGNPASHERRSSDLTGAELKSLLSWIENNLEKRLTVQAMAELVNRSVVHFSREFKQVTGSTPWEHVVDSRLRRAALMLRQGEPVCAAAHACGFFDQAHLSRLFKIRYGSSPSSYRKQHTTNQPQGYPLAERSCQLGSTER